MEKVIGQAFVTNGMKTRLLTAIGGILAAMSFLSASAQTAPGSQPVTGAAPPQTTTGGLAANSMTFSNSSGQVFTVQQLATQLRNLRNAVDQTLPMLTAFNQTAAATAGSQGIAGRLEGIVSGALSRNGNASPTVTNLLGGLRGLLGNNGTTGTDTKTTQDLVTLQNDLQPLPGLLQGLNVGGTSTTSPGSQIISAPANAGYTTPPTNTPGAPPTPTGRP